MNEVPKLMAWLSGLGGGAKILHIYDGRVFCPYTQFPQLTVPDPDIKGFSKGLSTMQKLKGLGYKLVTTETAMTGDSMKFEVIEWGGSDGSVQ